MKAMFLAAIIAGVSASAVILFLQKRNHGNVNGKPRSRLQNKYDGQLRLSQHAMG